MDVQSTIHPFRNTFYLIIYLELVPHSLSLSHLLSCLGITNSEPLQTHRQSSSLLMLPNEGDIVLLIITSVFTPQRFFAQMPIGANMLMTEAGTVFYQSVITILSFWMLPPSPTLYLGWGGGGGVKSCEDWGVGLITTPIFIKVLCLEEELSRPSPISKRTQ